MLLPEVEKFYHLKLGKWECEESPTGKCIYDYNTYPELDQCSFCGEPHNRK